MTSDPTDDERDWFDRPMEEPDEGESVTDGTAPHAPRYRYTVGSIVAWALFRAAAVVIGSLLLYEYFRWVDYPMWWMITIMLFYAIVIHPIQVQYRIFREETRAVMSGTLCASCKYFEPTGVVCSKLDEHVSETYIPCEGQLWEPRSFSGRADAED
jgi:hypothetical protein